MRKILLAALAAASLSAAPASAQDGVIVYRLGRDTAAIEQFSRTATRMTGEMVSRTGGAVARTQYEITLSNGRPTAAVVRRLQADGTPVAVGFTEVRYALSGDSVIREAVFKDSTQRRAFRAQHAFPLFPVFAYAPLEVLYSMGSSGRRDSISAFGLLGNNPGYIGLEPVSGDTLRLRGSVPYNMLLRFDRNGRLLSVDGSLTTNKSVGTRTSGRVDIAALAAAMKPTGQLSPRQTAYAAFSQGPITINYGSPQVRGRTVWGGMLIPFDSVWRTGANEATHLATSKTMQLGEMTLTPGVYTLWTQHTQNGTYLIVNRQVGQWGTQYDKANDIGRVQMAVAAAPAHVEEFTITIRSLGQGRGVIDLAWGDKVATASFTAR